MNKFRILIGALALAVVAAAFIGCKKEKEAVLMIDDQTEINNPQNDAEVKRILNFKKQVETRKANPGTKSAETVTLDEAMNNIVDLFNVTYTEPMAYYTESERHYFTVSVALTADGSVLVDDVVSAYGQALAHAREAYHASTLPDKAYQRLMVTCTPQRDGTAELKFDGKYGTKTDQPEPPAPHVDGPFSNGDNWRCGGPYTGKCDDPSVLGNAAQKLEEQLSLKIAAELPEAPEGCRLVFVNNLSYTFSGPDYPGVFYTEDPDDTCIEWMYMNDYYAGEVDNIYNVLPEVEGFSLTAPYTFGEYYVASATVEYQAVLNEQPSSLMGHKHVTHVQYGRLLSVLNDELGLETL